MSQLIVAGNTTAANVLTGTTFSAGVNYNASGTMANNGANNLSPGVSNVTIPSGFYNGSGHVNGDANLIAANILAGKTIFGVAGSAGRSASGTATITTNLWNITGLAFAPSKVFYYTTAASGTTWSAVGMATLAGDIYENGLVNNIYGYNQGGSTALGQNGTAPTWGSTFVNNLYLGLANSVPIKWWAFE